jgi:acylphosphatase
VEGEAQGSEDALQKLLQDINRGPRAAHVVKLEKKEIDVIEGENSFIARYTPPSTPIARVH